jgi:di- and tripeptidase
MVQSLGYMVSLATVSSNPRHQADCRRGASFLRSLFRSFGASVDILPVENPQWSPVILAVFKGNPDTAPKRKRILFYGHYDVIPAENLDGKWNTDPFHLQGIDGYLYGRGTSDNKGPIMAAIYAVAELVAEKSLNSDIVFLIEGEEESGSRGFEKVVQQHKARIGHIDCILLANSYWLDDHVPCLTYGLRGVIHATLKVRSDLPDLHSGVDGSALVDESLKDLVLLLNSLAGRNGKVKLPGFYDPILPLTAKENALYRDITAALLEHNPELGDQKQLAQTLQQRWREASLTIHRFETSGPENSTIIPKHAKVAISLRLVPNQEAGKIASDLVYFLRSEFDALESRNHLEVTIDHKAEPWLGDFNNAIYKTLEEGIMRAWYQPDAGGEGTDGLSKLSLTRGAIKPIGVAQIPRRRPLYIREGGSIPAIRFLEKEFNAPAAHFPCGQSSDNAHLDNERLRLLNLYKSKDVFKWVFRKLPQQ